MEERRDLNVDRLTYVSFPRNCRREDYHVVSNFSVLGPISYFVGTVNVLSWKSIFPG